MIDLHAHILPRLDDGACRLEASHAVGDEALGQWLTQDVPTAVVEGGPLPPRPERRNRRGFRLRLRR